MISYLSVENAGSFSSISVLIDEELKFKDILRGNITDFIPIESGSANIEVINHLGKSVFDVWLAFKPNEKHRIIIYDDIISIR